MINWQLSKRGIADQYQLTVSRARVSIHRCQVLFWSYPLTGYEFSNDRRLKFNFFLKIHMKYVVYFCRTVKILISNWPRTRKLSQLLQVGQTVGHVLRLIFMLWLVKIWPVNSCGKFMQFCVNLWCFSLSFSSGCTKLNSAAIRSLLLFTASLFIGFLVEKYVTCQSPKSDFRWHRFRF